MPLVASKIVFAAGFVVYVVIRGVYEKRAKGVEKVLRRVDAVERILLGLVALGCLLLPALAIVSPWLAFADGALPAPLVWAGMPVLVAALWLFWRSHADLGRNWSPLLEIAEGHELITRGVYARVRHPMYAAIFLFGLAQFLLLQNWLAGPAAVVTFAALYLRRVPREEALMYERFGDAWRDYARRTGRLWPRLAG